MQDEAEVEVVALGGDLRDEGRLAAVERADKVVQHGVLDAMRHLARASDGKQFGSRHSCKHIIYMFKIGLLVKLFLYFYNHDDIDADNAYIMTLILFMVAIDPSILQPSLTVVVQQSIQRVT